jgi:hypothetical protein
MYDLVEQIGWAQGAGHDGRQRLELCRNAMHSTGMRSPRFVLGVLYLTCCAGALGAQGTLRRSLRISGDTTGTPHGCSVNAAITALDGWFRAVSSGDTLAVPTHLASNHGAFSVMPFAPGQRFWRGDTNRELMDFLRYRARAHDTLRLRGITFFGWLPIDVRCKTCERHTLSFMPDYERSADDLPPGRHPGLGKGGYQCRRGLLSLNLAPGRPGTR